MNRGIVEAWTGVIRLKPMEATASKTHSDKGGVNASQAREGLASEFGAMLAIFPLGF